MKAPTKAKPKGKATKKAPATKPAAKRRAAPLKASQPKTRKAPQPSAEGPPTVNPSLPAASLLMLALDTLGMNGPYQQRRTPASAEADAGLVESIRIMGVLQPILVRWDDEAAQHQVVEGHRRVTAARAAGLEAIPAVQVAMDERTSLAAGVAANTQRAPLAPVDLWRAIVHLQEKGWTLDGAAMALGTPKRLARQLDKLGRLHPDMIAAIGGHDMPEEDELAIIAGAPHQVQQDALKHPDAWDDDWDREEGTGTVRKVPDWYSIANLCRVRRIPQSRAIFDTSVIALTWDEDLFAQPDDADRFTTTDIAGFLTAQNAALVAKTTRGKLRSAEWDAKAHGPRLPAGWTRTWDPKTVGAVRFAAVKPEGYDLGVIVETIAVPPPEPVGKKGSAGAARKESAVESHPAQSTGDDAQDADPDSEGSNADSDQDSTDHVPTTPAPPKPGRGPLTEKGRILVAAAKTAGIRCALRDRLDHSPTDLLIVLVLALAGDNVSVLGDPASPHRLATFHDLVARMVDEDGAVIDGLVFADVLKIAAEAAARMIVCGPTGGNGNVSGAAAEWIGAMLDADRSMPRLDTAEILATVSGDALKAADIAAGGTGKGTSKAIRERLASNTEGLTLPGSAFGAPGPVRAERAPDGHVGPFPCDGCSDPEYCCVEALCERAEDGGDE